jgi:hypothetical protein
MVIKACQIELIEGILLGSYFLMSFIIELKMYQEVQMK